jgi:hypothetical protein
MEQESCKRSYQVGLLHRHSPILFLFCHHIVILQKRKEVKNMTRISLDQLMDERAEVLPSRDELSVIDCGGARLAYDNYHSDCDYTRNCDYNQHCNDYNQQCNDYNQHCNDNRYDDCGRQFNNRW